MMTQTNVIDAIEQKTTEAIHAAGAYASPDWYSEAEAAVSILIKRGNNFTTDDVWRLLAHTGLKTPEPRAMGSVIQQFTKDGQIIHAGRYVKSIRPECHRRPLAVWHPVHRRKWW